MPYPVVANTPVLGHNCQMDTGTITATISGADPDSLDELARGLWAELQEVSGLTIAEIPSTDSGEGTRSAVFVASVGSLALGYYGGTMVKGIVEIVKTWLNRHHGTSVTLEKDGLKVELNNMSANDAVKVWDKVGQAATSTEREETD
jgi:hypothetical protein